MRQSRMRHLGGSQRTTAATSAVQAFDTRLLIAQRTAADRDFLPALKPMATAMQAQLSSFPPAELLYLPQPLLVAIIVFVHSLVIRTRFRLDWCCFTFISRHHRTLDSSKAISYLHTWEF